MSVYAFLRCRVSVAFVLLTVSWLGGCALPPVVSLASFVGDGVSYAQSGKSLTDRALSAMLGANCAIFRLFDDGKVCRPAENAVARDRRTRPTVVVTGVAETTELFALIQDDGALEVFVHDPARRDDPSNLQLVLRVGDYAANPGRTPGFQLNGIEYRVDEILS